MTAAVNLHSLPYSSILMFGIGKVQDFHECINGATWSSDCKELLHRRYTRYLLLPWPSVTSLQQWKEQVRFSMARQEGIGCSVLEDPSLMGMLAARSSRGLAPTIRNEAATEAEEQARKAREEGKTCPP